MTLRALRQRPLPRSVTLRRRFRGGREVFMRRIAFAAAAAAVLTLAMPPCLRAGELEVPFEVEPSQSAILVRGFANGKPVALILDTGATRTILSRDLLPGAAPLAASRFSGDGPGLAARGRYALADLELGGRAWRGRTVVAMNLDEVSKAYRIRIDGLLGQDLLREFSRVTIDYRARRLRLEDGDAR
jgi:Aspartyl protease